MSADSPKPSSPQSLVEELQVRESAARAPTRGLFFSQSLNEALIHPRAFRTRCSRGGGGLSEDLVDKSAAGRNYGPREPHAHHRGVEYFFLLRQVCNKGGCDSLHNPIPSFVASLLSGRGGCHVVNHVHVNHFATAVGTTSPPWRGSNRQARNMSDFKSIW